MYVAGNVSDPKPYCHTASQESYRLQEIIQFRFPQFGDFIDTPLTNAIYMREAKPGRPIEWWDECRDLRRLMPSQNLNMSVRC